MSISYQMICLPGPAALFDKQSSWVQSINPDEGFITLSKNCELMYIEEPSQVLKEANLKAFSKWFGGIDKIGRNFERCFVCLCIEVVFILPCRDNHVECGCLSLFVRRLGWACPMCRQMLFGNKNRRWEYTHSEKVFIKPLDRLILQNIEDPKPIFQRRVMLTSAVFY